MRISLQLTAVATVLFGIALCSSGRERAKPPENNEKTEGEKSKEIDSSLGVLRLEALNKELSAKDETIDALQSQLLFAELTLQKTNLFEAVAIRAAGEHNEAYALKTSLWPIGKPIPVYWENPKPEDEQARQWVKAAIERTWQKESRLVFTEWKTAQPNSKGIRIGVADEAQQAPHCKHLGRFLDGMPNGMVLNFTFRNWCPQCQVGRGLQAAVENVAIHEFGHAIGLAHEQNRPDAPGWCQHERQGTDGDYRVTVYDPDSIMNYCNPQWNNNGKLSKLDIEGARILYGSP